MMQINFKNITIGLHTKAVEEGMKSGEMAEKAGAVGRRRIWKSKEKPNVSLANYSGSARSSNNAV